MPDPWYLNRPIPTDKNKLEGIKLSVFADIPPKKVKLKSGAEMNSLTVFNPKDSITYRILVTDTDIDNICKIVSKGKSFVFRIPYGKQWAEVEQFGKKSD